MHDAQSLPWLAAPLQRLREQSSGHALLLHGAAGTGLFELALQAAHAWLCEEPPGPCGRCAACRLATARSHPDLLVLVPEAAAVALGWAGVGTDDAEGESDSKSRRKPSRDIKIDAVRLGVDWAHTSPARDRGKVGLIYPAEALNPHAAQALLKTLEEPPGTVRWLLCTSDPDLLLPTLRSRCQQVRIAAPARDASLQWLAGQGVDDAAVLLAAANGAPLAVPELLAEGLDAATWKQLPRHAAAGDAAAFAALALPRAIAVLQQICHDAMAASAGAAPRYFPPESLPRPGTGSASWPRLVAWSRALLDAARSDTHPWSLPLRVEALVLQGAEALSSRAAPASRRGG